MLRDFTSPDEIRAILGIAESELPDAVIELPLYERLLEFDFSDINSGIEAAFFALPDVDTRSSGEQLFSDCLQVYSAYAVAQLLVINVKMFAPQTITDSKTTLQRAGSDPWLDTRTAVGSGYNLMRQRLIKAYQALFPNISLSVSPHYNVLLGVGQADPVTGT